MTRRHLFERYIGIDYSGAGAADAKLPGLRAYVAYGDGEIEEIRPHNADRKIHWSRPELAAWLAERLDDGTPTIAGIDHAFSFPAVYFDTHGIERDWDVFLDDFHLHWPTDAHAVADVLNGKAGRGDARKGNSRWFRLTDTRAKGAKSVFHFNVPGAVAHSTHAGLSWLRRIRRRPESRVHFWPFDGWRIPEGGSAVVEAYPALFSRAFARRERGQDQHDAYAVAAWLRMADRHSGDLGSLLEPELAEDERRTARFEGWIVGIE